MPRSYTVITVFFLFFANNLFCQIKIQLDNADTLKYSQSRGDIQILVGNVSFNHEGNYLYCDSAFLYTNENRVEAFGNVSLISNNQVTLTSKYIDYDGNTKMAKAKHNVTLTDGYYILKTSELDYDLNNDFAYYLNNGIITDPYQTITSQKAYYYGESGDLAFANNVQIVATDYKISADSLKYDPKNELVYFFDNSTITDTNMLIYCDAGIYDMKNDTFFFSLHPIIYYQSYYIEADTVQFYRESNLTIARSRAIILDTINNLKILSPFIKLSQLDSSILSYNPAIIDIYSDNDTLTIISDTLTTITDSLKGREFVFNKNVRIFQNDLQAVCDSLVYNQLDSTFTLYKFPIFWLDSTQMTSDTMILFLKNENIDKMYGFENAFIIEPFIDTLYNQIKGITVTINFKENEIDSLIMYRQSELAYYLLDDEQKIIGVNYSTGNQIILTFVDRELDKVLILENPQGTVYPLDEFPKELERLKGFQTQYYKLISNRDEIYKKLNFDIAIE